MVYTVSPDLLRNIEKDELYYFSDLLNVFAQRSSPYKVAVDVGKNVIKDYHKINNHNTQFIKHWIDIMSYKPSPFERIKVDLGSIQIEETRYLKLCKETAGQKKMIVYSKQNISKHKCNEGIIEFEEEKIKILDKDNAVLEFNNRVTTNNTYINSQVAKDNSSINDSENK